MRVTYQSGIYQCQCAYAERHIAKNAGFLWDAGLKRWFTTSVSTAYKLKDYFDEAAKEKSKHHLLATYTKKPKIKIPPKEKLDDYQIEGAQFVLSRNRSYLGFARGSGKTIIAGCVAASLGKPFVYFCPPHLTFNVEEKLLRWAKMPVVIMDRKKFEFIQKNQTVPKNAIIPDSLLTRVEVQLLLALMKPKVVFVDEAHRFKNIKAQRTQALSSFKELFSAQHLCFMSGSPIPNRNMELYSIVSTFAPELIDFMSEHEFGVRYCDAERKHVGRTPWGEPRIVWDYSGSTNTEELRERLRPFLLWKGKEVLGIPDFLEDTVILGSLPKVLKKMDDETRQKFVDIHKLDNTSNPEYRRLCGEAKVGAAVQHIKNILEETQEKLVVFAYHKNVIKELEEGLSDFAPQTISGKTPMSERREIEVEFNRSPESSGRLLIIQYIAGGIGLDLQAAHRVVFVEFSWTPEDNDQAIGRVHRKGQDKEVLVEYLVFSDSIDQQIIEKNLEKEHNLKRFRGA